MAGINLTSPTGFTSAVLIADEVQAVGGSNDAISTMTKVNGVTVNACLELQSTTGALLSPRMTTTQKNALTTVVNGMSVFDTTLGSYSYYVNGVWGTTTSLGGLQTVTVTLTQAQVQGMYAAPVLIVPAPAAGFTILAQMVALYTNFQTTAFAGGGVAILQYGNTVHGAGTDALSTTFPSAEITATSSQIYQLGGVTGSAMTGVTAAGLYFSNQTAAFTGGSAASTLVLTVRYNVVQATV